MSRQRNILVIIAVLAAAGAGGGYFLFRDGPASAKLPDPKQDGEEHGQADHVELSPEQIANANLTIESAGPAKIATTLHVNGAIGANEERMTQIVPRFEGIVRAIHKRLGDSVRQGDPLITIESNDSLRNYDIRAPIEGTIIARSAAIGEHAGEEKPLFVIADLSTVWANFSVYRSDFDKLKLGQTIRVGVGEPDSAPIVATVSYISPVAYADTQTTTVRAVLPNDSGRWRPGQFVVGHVVLDEQSFPVAVRESALQTIEGATVVFVEGEGRFEPRPIVTGASDGRMVEVRSGLKPGERYVASNSFILKSELGKSSAEHSD